MGRLVGFDIGGTKCSVILGEETESGIEILKKETISTDKNESPEIIIDRLFNLTDKLAGNDFKAVGVSCGGPLDSKTGVIKRPPNLPLWDDVHITDMISKRYNVPAHLQNDANACALAEWKLGAGKGTQNMVFFTFGTGLGAGLILDGKLYEGTNGNAGEAGHIRLSENGPVGYGKMGSFEGFCSGAGIAQLGYSLGLEQYQKKNCPSYFNPSLPLGGATAKSIAEAAQNGDRTAISVYEKCGEYLGKGLSVIIDILNPERIVLGSVFARSSELLAESMNKVIAREALTASAEVCKIVPALLGESIGDFAALITATV